MRKLRIEDYAYDNTDMEQPVALRPRHGPGERFLKGPIPWNYLCQACSERNAFAALRVAIVIHLQSGIENDIATVKPNANRMRELGLNNTSWRRGINELERLNLISVVKRPGALPTITILEAEHTDD